jgi:very-short-patch-repair endonuclease
MAAVLACGDGALLSHRSAAAVWGIGQDPPVVEVTVASIHGRSRPGIVAHRAGTLGGPDVGSCDRLPCTSLARTMLDLAAVLDRRSLERAVDRAETLRVFDLGALHDVLRRNRGRRGTRALAAILADYDEPAIGRSEAEESLFALIDSAGLTRPRVNAWIGLHDGTGYEADFLWPESRLIVEVDGRTYHARRSAFEHDRRRDRKLALAGFETLRYAASEISSDPGRAITEIRAFLSRGGYRP